MSATHRLLAFLILAVLALPSAEAQLENTGKSAIEIYSDGGTRFEGNLAVAEENVVIYYGGARMYGDYAQYNPTTHDVLLKGHVKIYEEKTVFSGESALYNLDTKEIHASDFLGDSLPFHFQGDNLYSLDGGAYGVKNGFFTTQDSSKPDYRLRARTVRIYPDNRIIFSNATLFIGTTPVFWWPYLYQSLDEANAFLVTPGYSGKWGAFVLGSYSFPVTDKTVGRLHLDYRTTRGPGAGLDLEYKSDRKSAAGTNSDDDELRSYSTIRSYLLNDSNTEKNQTSLARPNISTERYRLSWQARLYMTEDWSATIDVNKLSDSKFLEDFYPGENRLDPQPDTVAAVTKTASNWTFTALGRAQWNQFQQTTERLPEFDLDFARSRLFGSPIYYEGQTSATFLNKAFSSDVSTPDQTAFRADTFHQISYPHTYFNFLSIVPRAGFRATYYDTTGRTRQGLPQSSVDRLSQLDTNIATNNNLIDDTHAQINALTTDLAVAPPADAALIQQQILALQQQESLYEAAVTRQTASATALRNGKLVDYVTPAGSALRTVFNLGLESSFKVSRTYNNIQLRWAGVDGIKHVVQPYMNYSYVATPSQRPRELLPIDTYIPSTQLPPLDFPQATALDSIDTTSVLRLGLRNRLLTKRNDRSFTWLELDSFFNVNFQNPYDPSNISNLFNQLRFTPVPWLGLAVDSQVPLSNDGFSEVNTSLNYMPSSDLTLNFGHRYLQDNPFFINSSLLTFGAYYQIDPNWGVGVHEQYELDDSTLESQRYTLYRDLTSWVASLSTVIRDNGGKQDVGIYLTFTLKDLPNLNFNFNFDPGSTSQE